MRNSHWQICTYACNIIYLCCTKFACTVYPKKLSIHETGKQNCINFIDIFYFYADDREKVLNMIKVTDLQNVQCKIQITSSLYEKISLDFLLIFCVKYQISVAIKER